MCSVSGLSPANRAHGAGSINTPSINTFRVIRDTKKLAIFAALQFIFPYFFRALRALFEPFLFNKLYKENDDSSMPDIASQKETQCFPRNSNYFIILKSVNKIVAPILNIDFQEKDDGSMPDLDCQTDSGESISETDSECSVPELPGMADRDDNSSR